MRWGSLLVGAAIGAAVAFFTKRSG